MTISLLPRPSLLTSAVVAVSVTTGLACGAFAAGLLLVAYRVGNR